MKNILVTGNGFDIAHGLYTRYIDFYYFCIALKSVKQQDLAQMREMIALKLLKAGFKKSTANIIQKKKISDEQLKKMIKICQNNYWLNCIDHHKRHDDPQWCDIEGLIAEEINKLDKIAQMGTVDQQYINKHYDEIEDLYDLFLDMDDANHSFKTNVFLVKKRLFQELQDLTWMLECYLKDFLNTIKKRFSFFNELKIDYVINFNYTDTYHKMYDSTVPIHYIHGKIRDNDLQPMNMVFGIGDTIGQDDNNYDYIEFQKYYQRIVYKTGNQYFEWLNSNDSEEVFRIFIFGHSLNEVDGDIIERLLNRKHTNIYIFYYDQEALNQIVANLTRILGKDTIIDYTNKNKIVFHTNELNCSFDQIHQVVNAYQQDSNKVK